MRSAPVPPGTADEAPFDPDDFVENPYKVELDIFEGPMDLLLYLIKKEEIDIYDIPIERITKQYMSYLDTFKLLNIGLAGEFLVMAANLCYIKSRMMLPKHVQPPEEDADEEDPRWDLIRQLIEYKKFKEAARKLGEKEAKQQNLFSHKPDKIEAADDVERPLDDGLSIFDLIRAFQNISTVSTTRGSARSSTTSTRWATRSTTSSASSAGRIDALRGLFKGATTKHEMIVTFLAVLELMKLNFFRVRQERVLGEIELHRNEF